MRDELVDSSKQLAVERAYTTDYFTVGHTEGIQVGYQADRWRAMAMIHDGTHMANSNFNADLSDFAIAARAEVKLMGDWSQFDDYAA